MPTDTAPGMTVSDVAKRYRVSPDKVRAWIRRGELAAINTADERCARPRFIVMADALTAFERGRQAATLPPQPAKRRRRTVLVDYYPD